MANETVMQAWDRTVVVATGGLSVVQLKADFLGALLANSAWNDLPLHDLLAKTNTVTELFVEENLPTATALAASLAYDTVVSTDSV